MAELTHAKRGKKVRERMSTRTTGVTTEGGKFVHQSMKSD